MGVRGGARREVLLVDSNEEWTTGQGRDGGFVFVVKRSCGVEDEENDVGFGHGFAGFGDAEGFDLVGSQAQAGGVDEFDGDAFERDAFGDEVAGGAGRGGDDGPVALDETVEKRRLTGVGAAYDGQAEAFADDAAVGEGLFERLEGGLDGLNLGDDLVVWEEVDLVWIVFGGEVDAGFEGGDEVCKLLFYWEDEAGEGACEMLGGDAGLVEGRGLNEVVDGFGLGEVEAAGEEGALGEFAGFGESGAGGNALAEEMVEQDGGAVGGDFDYVFGGVGVGGLEPGDDGLVESLACAIKDFPEAGLGGGEGVAELEERFGEGAGVGTGEPDDTDAAASGRGGDGDDGVCCICFVFGGHEGMGLVESVSRVSRMFTAWCSRAFRW